MPNLCSTCNKSTAKGKSLECSLCSVLAHITCVTKDRDISAQELTLLNLPGILYYCPSCMPKLKSYHYWPESDKKLENITGKLDLVTTLVAQATEMAKTCDKKVEKLNNLVDTTTLQLSQVVENTKSYANVVNQTTDLQREVKQVNTQLLKNATEHTNRLVKDQIKCNAILHGMPALSKEGPNDLLERVRAVLSDKLYLDPLKLRKAIRIGIEKDNKVRPVRLVFDTETCKQEFLIRYNNRENKDRSFAKKDLTKEEQIQEFNLRKKRRELIEQDSTKKYLIRNGKLYDATNKTWQVIEL